MATIWRFEQRIVDSCTEQLARTLALLNCQISPTVFLVGISLDDNHVVVVPDHSLVDCGELQEEIGGIDQQPFAYPSDESLTEDEWNEQFRRYDNFCWSCWGQIRDGVRAIVGPRGLISSVSPCVEINRHVVALVVTYNRTEYERYPHMDMSVFTDRGRWPSLPFGVVEAVLNEFGEELRKHDAGRRHFETTEAGRLLRVAGEFFTRCNVWDRKRFSQLDIQARGTLDFFEACNAISSMPYERRQGIGGMIVADAGHKAVNIAMRTEFPILADKYRRIRKYVEMCQSGLSVLTDSRYVWGLGTFNQKAYDASFADVLSVRFLGDGRWILAHQEKDLIEVNHGEPRLPNSPVDLKVVSDRLSTRFGSVPEVERLIDAVQMARDANHGTTLVIARNAAAESARLAGPHARIIPFPLSKETMAAVTSIDGAVMIDLEGICHGIGLILDGEAGGNENPGRGSRFNSVVRYLRRNTDCLVVVVSEDGMIDVMPPT